jgi:signal peptidase II
VATLLVVADQVSKRIVTTALREGQSVEFARWLAPVFHITYVTNTGAAFGLFPNWGHLFVIVAVVVVTALVWYYFQLSDGQWLVQIALGLQLGGAVGNLTDRLRHGFVVDFIDLNFWPLRTWPVFNLADSSIVVGVTLLSCLMLWDEWHQQIERNPRKVTEGG